ncbi:hypothetical protein AC1031_004355 [Aphanomyces cochlioides]|nr:hypothetical protein AC1031_004355 [Aphanomyces cochlioides]
MEVPPRAKDLSLGLDDLCPPHLLVPKASRQRCQACDRKFIFFRKARHCRMCGDVFCSHCVVYKTIRAQEHIWSLSLCRRCAFAETPSSTTGSSQGTLCLYYPRGTL